MEQFLQVGVITSPHGVRGEVKVFPTTDDVTRFKKLKEVILEEKRGQRTLAIEQVKFFKNMVILKFKEFNNLNRMLNRVKPFSSNGRNEKNIKEAIAIDNKIKKMLDSNNIEYTIVNGDEEGCKEILCMILNKLKYKECE